MKLLVLSFQRISGRSKTETGPDSTHSLYLPYKHNRHPYHDLYRNTQPNVSRLFFRCISELTPSCFEVSDCSICSHLSQCMYSAEVNEESRPDQYEKFRQMSRSWTAQASNGGFVLTAQRHEFVHLHNDDLRQNAISR